MSHTLSGLGTAISDTSTRHLLQGTLYDASADTGIQFIFGVHVTHMRDQCSWSSAYLVLSAIMQFFGLYRSSNGLTANCPTVDNPWLMVWLIHCLCEVDTWGRRFGFNYVIQQPVEYSVTEVCG
jgi:hypothetical protein